MKLAQQRFWPDAQPLVERLGREFFRQLPQSAGIYQMRDARDVVLYVGKAKNLRHRLCSYRVANPERMAKRTLRLLNMVQRITWEECTDETAALSRESELLLEVKPRFNRAGVWRGPRRFVTWRAHPSGFELAVADAVTPGWTGAGSFGAQAKQLHRALVRLLWCRLRPAEGLAGMPAGWFQGAHGNRVLIPHPDSELTGLTAVRLASLAQSESEGFLEWLGTETASFGKPLREEDLEMVMEQLAGRFAAGAAEGSGLSAAPWQI